MTQRAGRKPLMTGHVNRLHGSSRAKDRMRVFLDTLRGSVPVAKACTLIGVKQAQFFHLRHQWLQGCLELCEPRQLGRPPNQQDAAELAKRNGSLEAEVAALREQLQGAQVREEIAMILGDPGGEPLKKTDDPAPPGKPR